MKNSREGRDPTEADGLEKESERTGEGRDDVEWAEEAERGARQRQKRGLKKEKKKT